MRKNWQDKLADNENYPKILKLEEKFPCYPTLKKMGVKAGDDIVLVNPSHVIRVMKSVPIGKLITIREICIKLAQEFNVQGCCSLTVGIFIMTAANAVDEAAKQGRELSIPYWRTLKAEGLLNEKFPGGLESHKTLLEKEGFKIIAKGRYYFVQDFSKNLIE